MGLALGRKGSKPRDAEGACPPAPPLRFSLKEGSQDFAAARQDYLDALPIAAAIIGHGPHGCFIECGNLVFRRYDAPLSVRSFDSATILERNALGERVGAFLSGEESDTEFVWRDGDSVAGRYFTVRLSRLTAGDAMGARCMLSLLDRTAELQTENNLRREMVSDSLTGLPNRAGFAELLENTVAGDNRNVAVLIVDLVRFSRINECIGSMAGDELIITVARRLVHALRVGDRLARLGGDEFGIIVNLIDGPGDALHVAKRVQEVLSAPFRLSDLEIRVECTIGCAMMYDEEAGAADVETLLRHAQFALKRAKQTGRTEVYQPSAFKLARQRFSMETALRRAIENDRLELAFQPLIDLSNDRVSGFEALARWEDEEHGVIPPTEFIPVAEDSGLIVPLGRWALDRAARTISAWDTQAGKALPVRVSVNLSAIQLARDDVAAIVAKAIETAGIAGNRFTLELTESAVIADPERAVRVLDSLKELDAALAMDDFGTGYSSLAYLQRLPLDILKIDRSFISGMLGDKNKIAIVRAVLSLADALGMETTAEGIESHELSQTLAAMGCATGQGYFYAGPLDADAAYAYLASRNS